MKVYRITKEKYANDLSGRGAERFGGRWNSKGVPVLYTSQHRSLCILELLVHTPVDVIPKHLTLLELELPTRYDTPSFTPDKLPEAWRDYTYDDFTRQVGDEVLQTGQAPYFYVPSVIIPQEWNIVINPDHEANDEISIIETEPFELDTRLVSK